MLARRCHGRPLPRSRAGRRAAGRGRGGVGRAAGPGRQLGSVAPGLRCHPTRRLAPRPRPATPRPRCSTPRSSTARRRPVGRVRPFNSAFTRVRSTARSRGNNVALRGGSGCSRRPSRPVRCSRPRWVTTGCRGASSTTTSCCATCWATPAPGGGTPRKLAALADEISAAFGGARLRPDSPAEVLRAFHRAGHPVTSTRSWELQGIDHPAVPLLQRYKELYRIWTAHGWAWRQMWVRDGRFRAEYVPGRRRLRPLGHPGRRRAADSPR